MSVINWEIYKTVLIGTTPKFKFTHKKNAGFDLDGTIISYVAKTSKSDKIELMYDVTIEKLKETSQTHNIIIISNQTDIISAPKKKKKIKKDSDEIDGVEEDEPKKVETPNYELVFKSKMEKLYKLLKVEFTIYAAFKKDNYRKPRTGIIKDKVKLGLDFFCGDYGGRFKDKADTDLKFAKNLDIKFYTPENYFLGKSDTEDDDGNEDASEKNITNITYPDIKGITPESKKYFDIVKIADVDQEMIINVGCPGSGKSYFSTRYFVAAGYKYINNDTAKPIIEKVSDIKQRNRKVNLFNLCKQYLEDGKSVVIDNTNPTKVARAKWIAIAKEFKVPVRVVYFDIEIDIAKHNNYFRNDVYGDKLVPDVALYTFKKKLQEPKKSEGIKEIVTIKFEVSPEVINNADVKKKYYQYYF